MGAQIRLLKIGIEVEFKGEKMKRKYLALGSTLVTAYLTLSTMIEAISASRIGRFLSGFCVGLLWVVVAVLWSGANIADDKES